MKKLLFGLSVLTHLSFAVEPSPGMYVTCNNLSGLPFPSQHNTFEFGRNKTGEWVYRKNNSSWQHAGECYYSSTENSKYNYISCFLSIPANHWPRKTNYLKVRPFHGGSEYLIYAHQEIQESGKKIEKILVQLEGRSCQWKPGEYN